MAPHYGTGHRDFGELEGAGAGMAHPAGTELDQLEERLKNLPLFGLIW